MNLSKSILSTGTSLIIATCLPLVAALSSAHAAETIQTFATTDEAVTVLAAAVKAEDATALQSIFGPGLADMTSPDPVQAKNDFESFAAALEEAHHLAMESAELGILETGSDRYPFPVPLVKKEGRWFFDTASGIEELINRRIGRNELDALASARAYVDAQREYAGRDRDGDEVLEYAQLLISSAGEMNGLYWPLDLTGELSPLGPYLAFAQEEGYVIKEAGPDAEPQPFRGYLFKILTEQSRAAPGGKYKYIINGNMIGGFALVAWPAAYGETGIMTFIVNQQGRVCQKDLGPKTANEVKRMKAYDPDETWVLSAD